VTGDQQYAKASAKYFATGMQGGGGPFYVNRLDRPGRFEIATSQYVTGHSGAVLDFDWSPFDDSMLATASEDTTIRIWSIPDDWEPTDENGNAKEGQNLTESAAELKGHKKKVTLLRYHPTANNTLLSTGADYTVKVWDIESSQAVTSFDDLTNLVHDIVWDQRGDMFACSCKDKNVRMVDGRTGKMESEIVKAHDGTKSVKLVYANDSGKFFTFGASKQSAREIKVWDIKNLSEPIHTESVDTAAGAMIPLWDADTNILYLCGKGDGTVRLYEYEDKSPFIFKLSDGFRSNTPGKGYCMVPKRGLNIMKHETARIMKVTNSTGIHPLNFYVPRKSDAFQDDIFPKTPAATPACTFAEWMAGASKDPVLMSVDPAVRGANGGGGNGAEKKPKIFKSVSQLSKDLAAAQKRIEQLEGSSGSAPAPAAAENNVANDEAQKRIEFLESKLKETEEAEKSKVAETQEALMRIEVLENELSETQGKLAETEGSQTRIEILEGKLTENNIEF
jgi:coronin-1B/1C/6